MKYPFKDHRWLQKPRGVLPRAESQMCTSCRVGTDRAAPAAGSFSFYCYMQFAVEGPQTEPWCWSRRVQESPGLDLSGLGEENNEEISHVWGWDPARFCRSTTEDLAALMWLHFHLLQKFPGGEAQSCNHKQVTHTTSLLERYPLWFWFLLFAICVYPGSEFPVSVHF